MSNGIKQNPQAPCPKIILRRQIVVNVSYYSFDDKTHRGQIIVAKDLAQDVKDVFKLLLQEKFPISSVIPISEFWWDDELSMRANNSSGFNYRTITGTNRLSNHAYGRAIDINPLLNPYVKEGIVKPHGATYRLDEPGTITSNSKITSFLKQRGWTWGGDWKDRKDYQHFEKPLKKE